MSMYAMFATDPDLEQAGVWTNYGDFRVRIARAGGSNKKFIKMLETKTRPIRRAIETESLSTEVATELFHDVYAETIVLEWESRIDKKWKSGIVSPDDEKVLPFTTENVVMIFERFPELFNDIRSQAEKAATFREMRQEAEAGNS